jgi:hypothetical protein
MPKNISYIKTDKEAVMVVIHHQKQVASPVKRAVLAVRIVKWVQSTHQPRFVSVIMFIPKCNGTACLLKPPGKGILFLKYLLVYSMNFSLYDCIFFFKFPIYLQSVRIHLGNGGKG